MCLFLNCQNNVVCIKEIKETMHRWRGFFKNDTIKKLIFTQNLPNYMYLDI